VPPCAIYRRSPAPRRRRAVEDESTLSRSNQLLRLGLGPRRVAAVVATTTRPCGPEHVVRCLRKTVVALLHLQTAARAARSDGQQADADRLCLGRARRRAGSRPARHRQRRAHKNDRRSSVPVIALPPVGVASPRLSGTVCAVCGGARVLLIARSDIPPGVVNRAPRPATRRQAASLGIGKRP